MVVSQSFNLYGVENFTNNEVVSEALVSLPVTIIIFALLFLMFYKFKVKKLLIYWYAFAFTTCVTITLSVFINELYALIIAICLFLLRITSDDDYFHNITELMIYGGITIVILPMLSAFSAIILLIIISIYDFIAVNLSKHMIVLAKTQFELNIFTGIKLKSGDYNAILGGGDIAFPLILAGVMLRDYSLLPAILVIYGALLGLSVLIMIGRDNKFYPAMPFLTGGCLLGLSINYLFLL